MKTQLAAAILVISALHASLASALGLGEVRVSSALNERLEAEIPLVNARGMDASQILVGIASSDDFAQADIERPYYLTSLKFRVVRNQAGQKVLRVTSPDVLREPYVNFLLELRWPKGRMLREYLILLEPAINSTYPEAGPVADSSSSAYDDVVVDHEPVQPVVAEAERSNVSASPDVSATRYQLPTRPVATSSAKVEAPAANKTPAAENQQSSPAPESSVSVEALQANAGQSDAAEVVEATVAAEPEIAATHVENAEIVRLQNELATSLENIDRAKLENSALAERVDSVESQVGDLEQLLELKEQELETVQSSLQQEQTLLDAGQDDQPEVAAFTESSTGGGDSASQLPEATSAVTAAARDGGGSASQPSSTPWLAIGGGLALLLGLFAWFSSRKKETYQATVFEPEDVQPSTFAVDAGQQPAAQPMTDVAPANDASIADQDERPEADEVAPADEAGQPEDPLAEADIYLAYGRVEQAATMLEAAIEAEPMRSELRLKLLEVYNELGEHARFEEQKAQLLTLDPSLESEIASLYGKEAAEEVEVSAQDLGLDIDTDTEIEPQQAEPATEVDAAQLADEVATKLNLARAYVDMGDYDGAREILAEVVEEGDNLQRDEAREMLAQFG